MQRVNSYKNDNGTWYFVEQLHYGDWITVGNVYDKKEYAQVMVDNHNLKLELAKTTA